MKIFLRWKHWQLFLFMVGIPLVIVLVLAYSFGITHDTSALIIFLFVVMFVTLVFWGWFYSIGTYLNRKLPSTVRMNLTTFRILAIVPVLYILTTGILIILAIGNNGFANDPLFLGAYQYLYPVKWFSIFCIGYSIYFISRSLKTIELQKNVTPKNYILEFICILVFAIGIWFIQPRINRIFASDAEIDHFPE